MCLAIPAQIVELGEDRPLATVEVSGVRRKVDVSLVDDDDLGTGDWVLVHVGFAMSRISAEHAEEQRRLLAMLGEDAEAIEELEGYGFGSPPAAKPA